MVVLPGAIGASVSLSYLGRFVCFMQVMLLLRTAEFKPYCIFIKPPPLKELRTSRLTVQQAGKAERPSNRTNMRTFKVLCCCFKFTKRTL